MKKRVLFVMNNLNCGGAEKALISLLETIDYSRYSVDLYLFKHEGLFMSQIPQQVHLLDEPVDFKYFDMSLKKAVKAYLRKGRFDLAILRAKSGYHFRSEKNRARCEQLVWSQLSKAIEPLKNQYDVAVGYLEKNPIYFCIDKVKANKKIGFIHNDYDQLGMDSKIDMRYFDALDNILTVSEECANVLKQRFPMFKEKIGVMYNIVSPILINKMSLQSVDFKYDGIKLVSVGRLNYQKGFELAINACKQLVKEGYRVKWYIIGEGEDRAKLESMIDKNDLNGIFILLGIRGNPYPYIRGADIYVQPSRFEGKSIAIDEAKILCKPIILTNFSTAKDQIKSNENGLIVDMNPQSLYQGIKRLIDDIEFRKKLAYNLSTEELGTESEIHKLYRLFA